MIISGEVKLSGIIEDEFWRALEANKGWEYFLAGSVKLGFDIRFNSDTGIYLAMKNLRRSKDAAFGSGIVRADGSVLGSAETLFYLEEAFFEANNIFHPYLRVRGGLLNTKLGLDTKEKKWFEGHGRIFFDSETGRLGDNLEKEMYPAGIHGIFDNQTGWKITGGWLFLRKDANNFRSDIQLGFIEAIYKPNPNTQMTFGFSTWIEKGNHFTTSWAGTNVKVDVELSSYGIVFFEAGVDISAKAFIIGMSYVAANQNFFADISYWHIDGDNLSSATDENFRNTASLRTTMIIDNADFGIGRKNNYFGFKIVTGFKITYSMEIMAVAGFYQPVHASLDSPDPGDEIDLRFRMHFGEHFTIEAAACYLYGSDVLLGDSDALLFIITTKADF